MNSEIPVASVWAMNTMTPTIPVNRTQVDDHDGDDPRQARDVGDDPADDRAQDERDQPGQEERRG